MSHPSLLLEIILISSAEAHNLISIGSILPTSHQNLETLATIKELMMSPSHITTLRSLPQLLLMKSESGIAKIDKNYSEFKFQDSSATLLHSLMMEKVSSLDGPTERSEPSFHSQENYSMSSMTPITMDAQPSP